MGSVALMGWIYPAYASTPNKGYHRLPHQVKKYLVTALTQQGKLFSIEWFHTSEEAARKHFIGLGYTVKSVELTSRVW